MVKFECEECDELVDLNDVVICSVYNASTAHYHEDCWYRMKRDKKKESNDDKTTYY